MIILGFKDNCKAKEKVDPAWYAVMYSALKFQMEM